VIKKPRGGKKGKESDPLLYRASPKGRRKIRVEK